MLTDCLWWFYGQKYKFWYISYMNRYFWFDISSTIAHPKYWYIRYTLIWYRALIHRWWNTLQTFQPFVMSEFLKICFGCSIVVHLSVFNIISELCPNLKCLSEYPVWWVRPMLEYVGVFGGGGGITLTDECQRIHIKATMVHNQDNQSSVCESSEVFHLVVCQNIWPTLIKLLSSYHY